MSRVRRAMAVASVFMLATLAGCADSPPPDTPPSSPTPASTPTQLVIGVDDLGGGYNPHLLADLSPATTALATLVLPSVFRPASRSPGSGYVLDKTVATSAEVTSQQPFTVSYELNLGASWSDNTPIAAEDFVYLWQRMRSEAGVVDAAGYRLITDVRSRAGGKAVDVVFGERYPAWQQLFSDLLPAHLLKDAPGSWTGALSGSIPVSGGPFRVNSVDRARGEIVLARNDLYWDTQTVLDRLVLRQADAPAMAVGLRSGEVPIAYLRSDATAGAVLATLGPAARLQAVPQPAVVQLGLRADAGPLADVRVRQAVGATVNRDALIALGTGTGPGAASTTTLRADAQLLAPSEPGYAPTAPAGTALHPDPAQAQRLLAAAGYTRDAMGRWISIATGVPLQITVGAPAGRAPYVRLAEAVRDQLGAAGISATAVSAPGTDLFTQPRVQPVPPSPSPTPSSTSQGPSATTGTTTGTTESTTTTTAPANGVRVDILVMPRTVGGDPGTELASDYGCPRAPQGQPTPPANPTGFCDPGMQPLVASALNGTMPAAQVIALAEPILWAQLPAIPLFQLSSVLASTPAADVATGVNPGPLSTGPVTGAQRWSKS